ncbi:sodium/potassium/calcium exchanger 1-like, partial [Hypomesus transpacificus]|uniref:sodium/potassium/calcium exchanger 1-like n=1 Tax=Hypomesus transpacificus TaxID=137520 RepID=UPI001F086941
MSVPFSNTHLRVPRGFGSILELLAKEVLRDQPQDIPTFAALYFEALLKEREESGMDPAEWAAKLEDRFYNNHSFKSSRGLSPTKVPAAASLNSVSSEEKIELSEAKNSPAMGGESSELSESEGSDEKEDATNKDLIPASPALSQDGAGRGLPDTADFSDEGRGWTEEGEEELADTDQGRATDGDGGQSEPEPYEPASFGRAAEGDEGSGGLRTTEEGGEEPELGWQEAMSEEEEEEEWAELHGQASIPGLAGVDVCAEELGEAAGQPAGAAGERGFSQDLKDEEEIFAAHDSSEPSSPEASLQEVMHHSEKVLEEEQGETQTDSRETLESVPTAVDIHQHQPEAAGKDAKRSAQASPEEGSEVCDENQTLEEGLGQVQAPEDVTEEDTTGPHQPAAPNQGDGHVQSQDEAMEPSAETEPAEEHPVQAGAVETASPHDAAHSGIEKDTDNDRDRRDDEGKGDGMKADESAHLQYSNETAGKEEGGADEHDEGRSKSTGELEAHHTPTAAAGTERTPEGDWEDTPRGGQDVERRGTDVSHPLDVSEKEEETTDEAEGEVEEEKACEEGDEKEMGAQETTGLDLSGTEDEAG